MTLSAQRFCFDERVINFEEYLQCLAHCFYCCRGKLPEVVTPHPDLPNFRQIVVDGKIIFSVNRDTNDGYVAYFIVYYTGTDPKFFKKIDAIILHINEGLETGR